MRPLAGSLLRSAALGAFAVGVAAPSSACAQVAPGGPSLAAPDATNDESGIVDTGIQASLDRSVELKRGAVQIADDITAVIRSRSRLGTLFNQCRFTLGVRVKL